MGYLKQQYGNPDLAMQQMRNQQQTYTDQLNNLDATIASMQKETAKLEKETKEAKKQHKKEERNLENAR